MNRSIFSREKEHPAGIYLFKVNNRNTRAMCGICSKLTIKTPLVSLLLTLNRFPIVLVFLLLTLSKKSLAEHPLFR